MHTKFCWNALIWKMTQCGIYCLKAFPMLLSSPFTLYLYRIRSPNIHALSPGGLEWGWHKSNMDENKHKDGPQESTTLNCCSCWGQYCLFCRDIKQREHKRLLLMPSKSAILLIYDIIAHTKSVSCFLFSLQFYPQTWIADLIHCPVSWWLFAPQAIHAPHGLNAFIPNSHSLCLSPECQHR